MMYERIPTPAEDGTVCNICGKENESARIPGTPNHDQFQCQGAPWTCPECLAQEAEEYHEETAGLDI